MFVNTRILPDLLVVHGTSAKMDPVMIQTYVKVKSLFLFSEYSCPVDYVKCRDGLQCVHKHSICVGDLYRYCVDGSSNDPEMCKGMVNYQLTRLWLRARLQLRKFKVTRGLTTSRNSKERQ